jgi:hypothetical protein
VIHGDWGGLRAQWVIHYVHSELVPNDEFLVVG